MKIQTLEKRLKKIGVELKADRTFILERKINPREFKIRAMISGDNIVGFVFHQSAERDDDIIFNTLRQITNHIFIN